MVYLLAWRSSLCSLLLVGEEHSTLRDCKVLARLNVKKRLERGRPPTRHAHCMFVPTAIVRTCSRYWLSHALLTTATHETEHPFFLLLRWAFRLEKYNIER